jgi:hypothetical protein
MSFIDVFENCRVLNKKTPALERQEIAFRCAVSAALVFHLVKGGTLIEKVSMFDTMNNYLAVSVTRIGCVAQSILCI